MEEINNYIDEFFLMGLGEKIKDPNGEVLFGQNIYISRKTIKHIVEQRSIKDGISRNDIKSLLVKAQDMLKSPEIVIQSKERRDIHIAGRFDAEINKGIVVVVEYISGESKQYVLTAYFREAKRFFKLFNKK